MKLPTNYSSKNHICISIYNVTVTMQYVKPFNYVQTND